MSYWCFVCGHNECPGCERPEDSDPELDSLEETPEGQGLTPERCADLATRSEVFQGVEAGRAAHIILGSLDPVRRAVA
jgi:hypothetical protein